ncbi:MAG: polysaccharide biosynthesis protein [Tardiphaga sp.]|nr:polysaccharide biosynthesis protein [Tardiphaga sp.]
MIGENLAGSRRRALVCFAVGIGRRLHGYRTRFPTLITSSMRFGGSFGLRTLGLLLGFAANVLLARVLGPTEFGAYTLAFTIVTVLAVPLHDGTANLLMREVARDVADARWENLRGALLASNGFVLIGAVAALVLAAPVILLHIPPGDRVLWWSAVALLPFFSLANLRGAALLGLGRSVWAQIPDQIVRPGALSLGLAATALVFHRKLGAGGAMMVHLAAAGCAFAVGTSLMISALPEDVRRAAPKYRMRAWMRSLPPLSLLSGVQVMNGSLAVLLLDRFATKSEISSFRIAFLGSSLLGIGMAVGAQILAPQIAELKIRGTPGQLQRRVRTVIRIMLGTALPPAVGILIFIHPLIHLIFGDQYIGAQLPIDVLILGQLITASTGAAGILLLMTGHENAILRTIIGATLINALLGFALVPAMGALGAAIASTVAMAASSLGMVWQAKKLTGIRCTPW